MTEQCSPGTTQALKPCPFCGGDDVSVYNNRVGDMHFVVCKSCGLEAPTETDTGEDAAIRYWNTRAGHTQSLPSHWAIEESTPNDGFECYFLLRDGITVGEFSGRQTDQRSRHLRDLVDAANNGAPVTSTPAQSPHAAEHGRHIPQTSPAPGYDSGSPSAQSPAALSEEERHAVEHARYQVGQASIINPDCCFDYDLVRDLLRALDRAYPVSSTHSEGTDEPQAGQS